MSLTRERKSDDVGLVVVDLFATDPVWREWSRDGIFTGVRPGTFATNPIIHSALPAASAHAQVEKLTLLTRDSQRYRTYFPSVRLVAPD